jgi:zinc/manganese transport system substrate-binding protein
MPVLSRLLALCFLACVLPLRAAAPLKVSSFSTILSEVASRVGGEEVQIHAHVKPGSDPHDFEPRPGDLKRVAEADLVLLSAKHMEGYVGKLQEASGGRARFLEVGAQLPSLWLRAEGADGKALKEEDPHWWHSIENTQKAVKVVRDALGELRPQQRELFQRNAATYALELGELQKWARQRIAELSRDKRKLVTSHDALQYFAKEYGFTVYPVEGLTPTEQPASRQVAELLTTIKGQRVKAVFSEDTVNPKVLKQITAETGAVLGGQLWVDGLGTGEASTYSGMFKHNVNTIVEALR